MISVISHPVNSWNNQGPVDFLRKNAPLFSTSTPVTSATSYRHCSVHQSLLPCHTMLRTFASTPRCCAARSKRRARSGRPALSAASMAALRTASKSFMIPGVLFEDLMGMSCKMLINRWMTRVISPSGNKLIFSIIHLPSKFCTCFFFFGHLMLPTYICIYIYLAPHMIDEMNSELMDALFQTNPASGNKLLFRSTVFLKYRDF